MTKTRKDQPLIDETQQGEQWSLSKLTPYSKNAKIHDDKQVKELAASIREFGWRSRILVDKDGVIVAGHGRYAAAELLGVETVPVTVARDLSDDQIRALRLADNKVTSTKYDTNALLSELEELHVGLDFDMSSWFDNKELDFATLDLGEIDLDALTDDIMLEVNTQSESTNSQLEEEDEQEFQLSKVLGFARVTAEQRRALTQFMAHLSTRHNLEGADALTAHAQAVLEIAE